MKIAIIGTGFVGVTSSVVYASFGNQVTGLDIDEKKVADLNRGKTPFYEPKLKEMLAQGLAAGTLRFTTSYKEAISQAEVIIVAVGTPSLSDGSIDLSYVEQSMQAVAPYLQEGVVLAIKSTVVPGTLGKIKKIIKKLTDKKVYYASLPEFLKEGTAVDDTLYPDRVVIGVENEPAYQILRELHEPLKSPIVRVRPESAQLAKYASNDYLALRIIYANALADICERSGADIDEVIEIMGKEKRIGDHYWYPGLGYGGSCFPKDVKALAHYCQAVGDDEGCGRAANLFAFMNELNVARPHQIGAKLQRKLGGSFQGKKIAVLGLAFKPNTDDQREAPALFLIPQFLADGATVSSFDPMVTEIADKEIAGNKKYRQAETLEAAVKGADLIIALIEWPQIVGFDFAQTREKKPQVFFDARNQFEAKDLQMAGYEYLGVGRQ